jgi:hypothetical protein
MSIDTIERRKVTPPELAARWGIAPEKIIGWILAGELRAINGASKPGGKPRYLIDEDDIAAFERGRQVSQPLPRAKRRNRTEIVRNFRAAAT